MNRRPVARIVLLVFGLSMAVFSTPGCALKPGPGSNDAWAERKSDDRNIDLSQEDMAKIYNDQNRADQDKSDKQFASDAGAYQQSH